MNILLVGTGAVASVIARHAVNDKNIGTVYCLGLDKKQAFDFLPKHKKIVFQAGDASKIQHIIPLAKKCDVVINASLPRFNLTIMKAALKAHANYLDFASELKDLKTAEQLSLHKEFKKQKRLALINAGVAPGVTNLVSRELYDAFDRAISVNIRCLEEQLSDTFVLSWSLETTLDDVTAPPLGYNKHRFVLNKPFEDAEMTEFPKPFGVRKTYNLYGDEIATLPKFLKIESADFKSGGTDIETSKILYKLGILRREDFTIDNHRVRPIDLIKMLAPNVPSPSRMKLLMKDHIISNAFLITNISVTGVVHGKKMTKTISVVYPDLKAIAKLHPGATYVSYPTGTAAYCFLKNLSSIDLHGVFPPEALEKASRESIMRDLKKFNIKFIPMT